MKSISDDTLSAIRKALVSRNEGNHQVVINRLQGLMSRVVALPHHKQETLLIQQSSPCLSKGKQEVTVISMGSYSLIVTPDTEHEGAKRFILVKRIAGQAKTFFDSLHNGVTEMSSVTKAIDWMDRTLTSLENHE